MTAYSVSTCVYYVWTIYLLLIEIHMTYSHRFNIISRAVALPMYRSVFPATPFLQP